VKTFLLRSFVYRYLWGLYAKPYSAMDKHPSRKRERGRCRLPLEKIKETTTTTTTTATKKTL